MLPTYLHHHALPLRSVTDGEDFSDLQPLKEILKNVRIVGLGESTHGTREFFQLKHRLTRFLVQEMGYSVFSIEAGMLPCMNIGEYATMGKGDRAAALASQSYWTWDTEEVTELIEWMRQHNLQCLRGDECRFVGYDIKPVNEAADAIRRIVKTACPELFEKIDDILRSITDLAFPYTGNEPLTADGILWVWGAITSRELTILQVCGRAAYELVLTSCRTVYQYLDGMVLSSDYSGRDRHMGENIIHLMDTLPPDAKIVVWAHNYHIARNPELPTMGEILHRHFGDLYFPFALSFTRGTFQSRLIPADDDGYKPLGALQEFDAGEPRNDFWEKDLMQVRPGDFYIDLRHARQCDEETLLWSMEDHQLFGAGGGYIPIPEDAAEDAQFFDRYTLGRAFDGVFHIEKTTRARPTPTGMRKEGQAAK